MLVNSNKIQLSLYSQAVLDCTVRESLDKIVRVARANHGPDSFPHTTIAGSHCSEYIYEPGDWWTSGFFPGSLWAVHERQLLQNKVQHTDILALADKWAAQIESQKHNVETHDIGFLIMPSFGRKYRLTKDAAAAEVIVTAARSLMTRWSPVVGCFRSWNTTANLEYQFVSKDRDFLVIIDNLMNLDLLYEASLITGDRIYAECATKHVEQTLKHHVRPDSSTYHLVVYDPVTGDRKIGLTCQGFRHDSTWARGQAWAIYGFATAYKYTKDPRHLAAARATAEYFMTRVGPSGIVPWDFDAPKDPAPVWDVSASMIAANGMLLIHDQDENEQSPWLNHVVSLLSAVHAGALTSANAVTLLDHSTVNNNPVAFQQIADRGLVYADYYFIELGNRLLQMGLVNGVE